MQNFKALKPCKFGEMRFYIGDEIPGDLIDPAREAYLIGNGTVQKLPETTPPDGKPEAEQPVLEEQPAQEKTKPAATSTAKRGKK